MRTFIPGWPPETSGCLLFGLRTPGVHSQRVMRWQYCKATIMVWPGCRGAPGTGNEVADDQPAERASLATGARAAAGSPSRRGADPGAAERGCQRVRLLGRQFRGTAAVL